MTLKTTNKQWLLAALLACTTLGAQAQQAVNTDNGKAVRRITFDREQVNITYADGSEEQGVSRATIRRNGTTTGIRQIENGKLKIENSVYDLQGRRMESSILKKGVFVKKENNHVRKTIKK